MTLDYFTLSDSPKCFLQKLLHEDSEVSEGESDCQREVLFHMEKLPISNIHKNHHRKPQFIKVNGLDHKSWPGSGDGCVCMTQHNRECGGGYGELLPAQHSHTSSAFSRVRSPHFTFPVLQEVVPRLSSCDLKASLFLCRMLKMWARSLSVLLYTYIYI